MLFRSECITKAFFPNDRRIDVPFTSDEQGGCSSRICNAVQRIPSMDHASNVADCEVPENTPHGRKRKHQVFETGSSPESDFTESSNPGQTDSPQNTPLTNHQDITSPAPSQSQIVGVVAKDILGMDA